MNLLDLSKKFKDASDNLADNVNEVTKKVASTILNDLVTVTPVDTSQALSNWQVSLKEPIPKSDKVGPYYPGEGGNTAGQSANIAFGVGETELEKRKQGDSIYISNVLPYIKRLNEGHSSQEPAGFVERSVLLARVYLQNADFKLIK